MYTIWLPLVPCAINTLSYTHIFALILRACLLACLPTSNTSISCCSVVLNMSIPWFLSQHTHTAIDFVFVIKCCGLATCFIYTHHKYNKWNMKRCEVINDNSCFVLSVVCEHAALVIAIYLSSTSLMGSFSWPFSSFLSHSLSLSQIHFILDFQIDS